MTEPTYDGMCDLAYGRLKRGEPDALKGLGLSGAQALMVQARVGSPKCWVCEAKTLLEKLDG